MPLPLVSIITPTYNHEKYIGDCIRSALAQTYQNWEIIIVDDGSTDNTPGIIRGFNDSRIKYIRQDHQGGSQLSSIYNTALRQAKGDLVAILEGDDFWPPDKLAVQTPYFDNQNIIMAYGDRDDSEISPFTDRRIHPARLPAPDRLPDLVPAGTGRRIHGHTASSGLLETKH